MKTLLLTLLFTITANAAGLLQNEDFKTEGQLISAGGTKAQLLNDSKIYLTGTAETLNDALGVSIVTASGTMTLTNKTFISPLLEGAILSGTTTLDGVLTGGTISGALISGAAISGGSVSGALITASGSVLTFPNISNATISSSNFLGGLVSGSSITASGSILTFPNISNATISSSSITGGTISGSAISGVSITGSSIDTTSITSGVFPIARGGTNNGALGVVSGGVYYGDSTKIVQTTAGVSGQVLRSQGSNPPVWSPFTSGGATLLVSSTIANLTSPSGASIGKGAVTYDNVYAVSLGKLVYVHYKYRQISGGPIVGSGDILVTLPAGVTFDPVYVNFGTTGSTLDSFNAGSMLMTGAIAVGGARGGCRVVPFNSTQFRAACEQVFTNEQFWSIGFLQPTGDYGFSFVLIFPNGSASF